jgi:hypothetical protein
LKVRALIDYLDRRLGVHSGNGPEYTFYCPACIHKIGTESDRKKFAVNLVKQKGRCFRCDFKFRELAHLFRFINGGFVTIEERIMLRRDPPIVSESVSKTVASMLRKSSAKKRRRTHPLPREAKPLASQPNEQPWKRAFFYVYEKRGFTRDDLLRFDVHFCPDGEYAGYLIFPVYQGGEQVYWTSRYAGRHAIKSRNPPKGDRFLGREHCLFNYDGVIGEKRVALVEGPTDCMAHCLPPAGLMGKEMSDEQVRLIAALVDDGLEELVISLDPGAGSAIDDIRSRTLDVVPRVTTMYLEGGDPADLRERLPELVEARVVEPALGDRIRSRLFH